MIKEKTEISIEAIAPDLPAVQTMIQMSDDYMAALYPAESNHMVPLAALKHPTYTFLGAFRQGILLGMGALKSEGEYGEIKRVFVLPESRGLGCARLLMASLEARATQLGLGALKLELGIHQPEALSLYEHLGFQRIPPFGDYAPDPLSIFMEKII